MTPSQPDQDPDARELNARPVATYEIRLDVSRSSALLDALADLAEATVAEVAAGRRDAPIVVAAYAVLGSLGPLTVVAPDEGRAELHAATQDQIERARAETIPAPQED